MFKEKIYTIEEVAQHLRVAANDIEQEISAGNLTAITVAKHRRVRESDLGSFLNRSKHTNSVGSLGPGTGELVLPTLKEAPDFIYTWPNKKVEKYTEALEGIAAYRGKEFHVKLGHTVRKSAGKLRQRILVLVDRYATVEFVSAGENSAGEMASIIKDRYGKQLPAGGTTPVEYRGLPVRPYHDVVVGPGASNGWAVVCAANDWVTMVKHALIRYRFRKERPSKQRVH